MTENTGGNEAKHADYTSVIPAHAGIHWTIRYGNLHTSGSPAIIYMRIPCVYLLASKRGGTLYIGVTSDLKQRVWLHKNDMVEGFTKRYRVHDLVWYEVHETMEDAIIREKALKKWHRAWKIHLIEKTNPTWKDLFNDIN